MITLQDYWMGRDRAYADQLTDEIRANAAETVRRANMLLNAFYAVYPKAATRRVNSGWRPPEVNATTPKAAQGSKHLTARAVDLSDDDGQLDLWINSPDGLKTLADYQLWAESAVATPRWCHVQTVPPGSGRRIFIP